jgi:hypothetical protein
MANALMDEVNLTCPRTSTLIPDTQLDDVLTVWDRSFYAFKLSGRVGSTVPVLAGSVWALLDRCLCTVSFDCQVRIGCAYPCLLWMHARTDSPAVKPLGSPPPCTRLVGSSPNPVYTARHHRPCTLSIPFTIHISLGGGAI